MFLSVIQRKSLVSSLLIALLCLAGLFSCSKKDEGEDPVARSEMERMLDQAIEESRSLEYGISQGFLLRNMTDQNRREIEDLLYNIKIGLLRLQKDLSDRGGLVPLIQSYNELRSRSTIDVDKARFDEFLSRLAELFQSMDVQVVIDLFSEDFSNGLGDFRSWSNNPKVLWKQGSGGGFEYAAANGFGNGAAETWLFTPIFDLTNTQDVHVSFEQAYAFEPMASDLAIFISTDYAGGDPKNATWQEFAVEMGDIKAFYEWNKTGKLSLEAYQGERVVIGFRYRSEERRAGTWQIDNFALEGTWDFVKRPVSIDLPAQGDNPGGGNSGSGDELPEGLDELYFENFEEGSLADFVSFSNNPKVNWGYNDKQKSLYVNAYKKGAAETWLFSPEFDLSDVSDFRLRVRQNYQFSPQPDDVVILITSQFNAEDPAASDWTEVDYKNKPAISDSQWTTSELVELPGYVGQSVVIGFRYRAEESRAGAWSLENVQIAGTGSLKASKLDIDGAVEGEPEPNIPDPVENGEFALEAAAAPFVHEFKFNSEDREDLGGFLHWTVSGPALWMTGNYEPDEQEFARVSSFFDGQSVASEAWMLSPVIDLSGITNPVFQLTQAFLPAAAWESNQVMIANVDGDTVASFDSLEFSELVIATKPTEKYAFVESEEVSLAAYAGQKVVIGFRYRSSDDASNQWRIMNMKVQQASGQ